MMKVPTAATDDAGMYAMEDPPSDEPASVPSAFVEAKHDSGDRPKKPRKKKRSDDLLGEVAGEAKEVLARNRDLVKTSLITLAILAVVLGIVAAALPNGTFIAGASVIGLGLLLIVSGYALGTYIAYTEDMLHAALFVTIPLYTGYYIVMNWDEMWRPFALMFVGGLLITVGAAILDTIPPPEGEMIEQVQVRQELFNSKPDRLFFPSLPGGFS
jgi:hypothetical protein